MEFVLGHFWQIAAAVLGLGGLGGLIAVFALGIPVMLVIDKLLGIVQAAIGFFSTRLGQQVGLGLLLAGAFLAGGLYEGSRELARCNARVAALNRQWQEREEAAAMKFKNARTARDDSVAKDIGELVERQSAEIEALQKKVVRYESKDHPGCVLSADDDGVRKQHSQGAGAGAALAQPTRKH